MLFGLLPLKGLVFIAFFHFLLYMQALKTYIKKQKIVSYWIVNVRMWFYFIIVSKKPSLASIFNFCCLILEQNIGYTNKNTLAGHSSHAFPARYWYTETRCLQKTKYEPPNIFVKFFFLINFYYNIVRRTTPDSFYSQFLHTEINNVHIWTVASLTLGLCVKYLIGKYSRLRGGSFVYLASGLLLPPQIHVESYDHLRFYAMPPWATLATAVLELIANRHILQFPETCCTTR